MNDNYMMEGKAIRVGDVSISKISASFLSIEPKEIWQNNFYKSCFAIISGC